MKIDRPRPSQETVGAALAEVIHAGHQLLADRLDLALLEGQRRLGRAAVDLALALLGGLVLLGGLITLDVAWVDRLRRTGSGPDALLHCAALHGAIGLTLLLAVLWRRRARRSRNEGAHGGTT